MVIKLGESKIFSGSTMLPPLPDQKYCDTNADARSLFATANLLVIIELKCMLSNCLQWFTVSLRTLTTGGLSVDVE